jgi:hypothetical protein
VSEFRRQLLDPIELIKEFWPEADVSSFIEYDPEMRSGERDFWRRNRGGSDGSPALTAWQLQELLLPLVNREVCLGSDAKKAVDCRYRIGKIRLATVYKMVCFGSEKDNKHPGQIVDAKVPVQMIESAE